MTTINLYQNQQEMQKKLSVKAASNGFLFALGILVLSILSFMGLKIAVATVTSENEKVMAQVQEKNRSLMEVGNVQKIIDMQARVEQIKNNLQVKSSAVSRLEMTKALDHLSADINQGVVVTSYDYDNTGKVMLSLETSSYADLSKQILTLKGSDYFQNINITSISRGEKSIMCNVTMYIK